MTTTSRRQSRRPKLVRRQTQRITYKQLFITASSMVGAVVTGLLLYFQFGQSGQAVAALQNDYRTVSSGSWQTAHIWEKYDGSNWVGTNVAPDASANNIEIRPGHTVVISTDVKADQLTIDEGAKIEISKGDLTILNGQGTDLRIEGEMDVDGQLTISDQSITEISRSISLKEDGEIIPQGQIIVKGKFINEGGKFPIEENHLTVASSGLYEHKFDGGSLPVAKWENKSTCLISGVTSTLPDHMNQEFGDFEWNCPSQSAPIDFNGQISKLKNSLIITHTGSREICLNRFSKNTSTEIGENILMKGGVMTFNPVSSHDVTVHGSVNVYDGILNFNSANAKANSHVNIGHDLSVTGGKLSMNESEIPGTEKGSIQLEGNLSVTGTGMITESSVSGRGHITFNGRNHIQFASVNDNIKNKIDFTVNNGASLRLDNYNLCGKGDFTLNDGAAILCGSASGISLHDMRGNIQVEGQRYFSPNADYTFNSNVEQETGDGLPSQVRNLTLNNEKNCRLSSSVNISGVMNLLSGNWITGSNSITLGTGERNTGSIRKVSGHVIGQLNRWVNTAFKGEIIFPVGTEKFDNTASITYTKEPSHAGLIACQFEVGNVSKLGLPISDSKDVLQNIGYARWKFNAGQSYAGGQFDLKLQAEGFPGIQDFSKLHVVKRSSAYAPWISEGTHQAAAGTNEHTLASRSELSTFGEFGIASDNSNSLPAELIYFQANVKNKQVQLSWAMASEINNDYFTVERSENGTDYKGITTVKGAGTTTEPQKYTITDPQPSPGVTYYRLRQTTFDGKSIVCAPEKVHVSGENGNLSSVNIQRLGPNPFSSLFTAEYYSESNGDVSVELLNSEGRSIFKKYQYALQGHNTFTFEEGSKLDAGEYTVRISNSRGVSKMKLVKKD